VRHALPAVLAALALLAPVPAAADTISLKNGRKVEGRIVAEDATMITLEVEGGRVRFPRDMVAGIQRDGAGEPPAERAPAAAAPSAGVAVAAEEWGTLWTPDRRAGWRHCQARVGPAGAAFEEETVFLGEDGKVEAELRLIEESGPDLSPKGFLFRESSPEGEVKRAGRVENGRLVVETTARGEKRESSHPMPPGLRFPMAARAFVLREAERLPGGWKGTSYDPRSAAFVELALRVERRERVPWEGKAVDAVVLVRERDGRREEERVDPEGAVLTAELNGPSLVGVRASAARAAALRAGERPEASAEERRAMPVFVSAESGFRIAKPGIAWEFVPGRPGSPSRVTVRDVGGVAFVEVGAESAVGEPALAELGAALETRLRTVCTEFRKLEDGFGTLGGGKAFRLLCDARLKGDMVRTVALTALHGAKTWTVTASCPADRWEAARPFLDRILAGFEWL